MTRSLADVAAALVAGCREGREIENLDRLYAEDAVSVEAADMGQGRETRGRAGIRAKHDWWDAEMEMEAATVSDPYPHGADRFAVIFSAKGRSRSTGEGFEMDEIGVYTVRDGRIVREEFFYRT